MSKLVERNQSPRSGSLTGAPALAVQFFLIPFAVVAAIGGMYLGFRALVVDQRSAQEYLRDIRTGGRERQWPAAYELSRLLTDPGVEQNEPGLGAALVQAFEESADGDPRVRRYLAMAIGRLESPPDGAVLALLKGARDDDGETAISAVWALGSLGAPAAVPALEELYGSDDAGVRKMVVYALGAVSGERQLSTLRLALDDPAVDVQWNAAVALSRHGDESGVPVLRRMLDRVYVERVMTRTLSGDTDVDTAADVIISGIQAVMALGDTSLREPVQMLSQSDDNLRVRQAALEALKHIGA